MATYVLLLVNVMVFLFSLGVGIRAVIFYLGLIPAALIDAGRILSLFTSMFVHADFLHLLFNMYALFIFGRDVELASGRLRFLLLYFASGVAGGLAYAYYGYYLSPVPDSQYIPAVGASGAIFGVMAAFGVMFPNRQLALFLFFLPIIARAYIVIGVLALIQTILALALPFSSIAFTAHLGGFAAGLILSKLYKDSLIIKNQQFLYYS